MSCFLNDGIYMSLIPRSSVEDGVPYFVYRMGDINPSVGFVVNNVWRVEHAGPEDGEHQTYGLLGGEGWQPTHIWRIPLQMTNVVDSFGNVRLERERKCISPKI